MSENQLIYIVDDDSSVRRSIARLLEASGFSVRTFASGEEFLASDRPTKCDCVVVDMHMPGINGLELHQALLDDDIQVPVILMTGQDDKGVRKEPDG